MKQYSCGSWLMCRNASSVQVKRTSSSATPCDLGEDDDTTAGTAEKEAEQTSLLLSTMAGKSVNVNEILGLAVTLRQLPALLPPAKTRKKTLVLDLDETLVHSSYFPLPSYAFTLTIEFSGTPYELFVAKRPYVDKFLSVCSQLYEVVLFTASVRRYAEPLIDALDPSNEFVHHRLFRDSCIPWKTHFIKDLARLGRRLEGTIIIDNSSMSSVLQPYNAVNIRPWFSDTADRELLDLLPLLRELVHVQNIPSLIRETC